MWRAGVDSGGTFTDVCLVDDATGAIRVWKVPSTPDDPSRAIAAGTIEALREAAHASPSDVSYFGHGTTVATNTLIQHRGAPTALLTTRGFRDLLEIGRQRRPHLYDLQADKPPLLVPRRLRVEIAERLRHDGRVETPLDEAQTRAAVRSLANAGVDAVAVCFLYCYVDPSHERRVRRIVEEELPGTFVTCSHEVAPEFREYERLSTVVVNAYLGPVMAGYLAALGPRLTSAGLRVTPHITQSNGGVMSFEAARAQPVRTVLSGPATGVVGALDVGRRAGFGRLITFDMGGTSTDVALVEDGRPKLAGEVAVHGYPLKAPALDIHTVGAGGGSIAFVDAGGLLKVGPRSAGAVPGPVCYGLGNDEATVTDANVVLGTLNPTHLLGGRMRVDRARAERAIAALAARLDGRARGDADAARAALMATAQGIVSVVTANMAKAIRVISVQRGHDPRDYTLVAFGGAGPLHAARLARELEIPRVLVPRHPGILCALGLLLSDLKTNDAQTRLMPLTLDTVTPMRETFATLEARAAAWFDSERIAPGARTIRRSVDMRYAGQNYELPVTWPETHAVSPAALVKELTDAFERAHEQIYGYTAPEEPIQVVTFRLEATGAVSRPDLRPLPRATAPVSAAIVAKRDVWLAESDRAVDAPGAFVACPVYEREKLGPGHEIIGPAIIEQMDATTLVLPRQHARIDEYANVVIADA